MDEAIAAYRRAIAIDPTYSDAYSGLVLLYAESGQTDEAILTVREWLANSPQDEQAQRLRKRLQELN
jgi:tetratricopeptide (TPR) repeat protein